MSAPPAPGRPDETTVRECVATAPLSPSCASCACAAADGCAAVVPDCDRGCWALASCAVENCGVLGGAPFEVQCILQYCRDQLGSAAMLGPAARCFQNCLDECDLRYDSPFDELDAGF
jgi:hypothetical protein